MRTSSTAPPTATASASHAARRPPRSSPSDEPRIVLTWLTRLRWIAVVGQVLAVAVSVVVLGLRPPVWPIVAVIAVTIGSDAAALAWVRSGRRPPSWMVPALLLLDVALLTVLLYCTGGPDNPFCVLYLVHVAMAVVVLGLAWTWGVVAVAALCYGGLFFAHLPLLPGGRALPRGVREAGEWAAVVLVASLIAYFIGRVTGALRQRERELATARERAARNEQLASLTTLAAGAAHELGSPLGTIAVVARELEVGLSDNPDAADDARLIRREVDRCRAILDRMRVDIVEEGHHDTVGGSAVTVDQLLALVRGDLDGDQADLLRVELSRGAALPTAPAKAVRQALGVLVRNAFDAAPDGDPSRAGVTLTVSREAGRVAFAVADHGTGMPTDVLRRAGEPFFSTKPPGSGMGLGLYLVRLVADKYDGTFQISSTPGRGTLAVLTLPDDVSTGAADGEAADGRAAGDEAGPRPDPSTEHDHATDPDADPDADPTRRPPQTGPTQTAGVEDGRVEDGRVEDGRVEDGRAEVAGRADGRGAAAGRAGGAAGRR